MSYSPEAYEKAEYILSARRRAASQQLISRAEEIFKKIPGLKDIDSLITERGIKLSKLAMAKDAVDKEDFDSITEELKELEQSKKDLLSDSGYSEDYLTNANVCSICKDTGYTGGVMCSCLRKILSSFELFGETQVKKYSFADFSLDYYSQEVDPRYNLSPRTQMKNVLDFCKNYADTFSSSSLNLLMYGGAGLGKTFLCNCIATELTEKGYNVILQSAYNIFEIISKNKFNYKTDYSEDITRYYDCDLLILDDLGTEFSTEYSISALFDIINRRLTTGKPIIINANLTLKDMEKRYSDRIVSRLLTFRHLLFLGSDIRALSLR